MLADCSARHREAEGGVLEQDGREGGELMNGNGGVSLASWGYVIVIVTAVIAVRFLVEIVWHGIKRLFRGKKHKEEETDGEA